MVTKDKLLNSDYMVDSTLVHPPLRHFATALELVTDRLYSLQCLEAMLVLLLTKKKICVLRIGVTDKLPEWIHQKLDIRLETSLLIFV